MGSFYLSAGLLRAGSPSLLASASAQSPPPLCLLGSGLPLGPCKVPTAVYLSLSLSLYLSLYLCIYLSIYKPCVSGGSGIHGNLSQ